MSRLIPLFALVGCFGLMLGLEPSAGQTAKDKKGKGNLLVPEDFEITAGDPLSVRTPVVRPAAIKGAKSWTVETKKHRWAATAFALSPDGSTAATGGYDGIVRLWDIPTGKFIRALVGHGSYVYGLAFSPDGQVLASSGSFDGSVRIWNPKTGMTLRTLKNHKGYTNQIAWLDNSTLVVSGGESGFGTFWDVAKNSQNRTLDHGVPVTCVACSPNGKYLACGTTASAFIWDPDKKDALATLKIDGNVVSSVAWSPDSKFLVAGGGKSTVVWNVETEKIEQTLPLIGSSASWSPDGKYLAIGSGPVELLDAKTFKPVKKLPISPVRLGWIKENAFLVSLSSVQIDVCDVAEAKVTQTIGIAASGTMTWSPGKPIIAGIGGISPTLWDTATGKLLHTIEGHTGGVVVAQWSRDGKFLATGSADKTARIWDAATAKPVRTLGGHDAGVAALAWSPDGKIATGSGKLVRIFAANSDKLLQTTAGHTHPVTALAWSRDGKTLASGSADRNVIIWNQETGKPIKTLEAVHDVQTVIISPDGRLIASGGSDEVLRIFNIASGKLLHSFETGGSPPNVAALAFSSDSTLIASGRSNHTMQIWSLKTGQIVHSVQTMAPVHSVAWTADGKTVATGTLDRAIRFWDASNGRLRATLVSEEKQIVSIGADGHYRAPEAESSVVYVIQTDKAQETFEPKVFSAKYPWRNNPLGVKLTGN